MRSLILAIAVVLLCVSSFAAAHGRHAGGTHIASAGKSPTVTGINNDGSATSSTDIKPDAKPHGDAATLAPAADTDKPHHKSGRAPDEEEVMQAEH
jgi:hypothetical protein